MVLIIRDGWGHNPDPKSNKNNAVYLANTPNTDQLLAEYPNTLIHVSGEQVGLPVGVMGNSEVGHQNIGAGRIVNQEIMRITRTIRDGSFFKNEVLLGAFEHAKATGGSVHLMGLFSDGRVHSDLDHAYSVAEMGKQAGFDGRRFFVHAIMDGRDTPPDSGKGFIEQLEAKLREIGMGRVASVVGRFYAMDRDNRWDRVFEAYKMLTAGADLVANSAAQAVQDYYHNPTSNSQIGDEFILPTSIAPEGKVERAQLVKSGDAFIFFNYRGDRPREISKSFVLPDDEWKEVPKSGFDRGRKLDNLYYVGMTEYEKGLPIKVAFPKPPPMKNIFGEYIGKLGIKSFRCAETEKYPHVTFFFNDYRDQPFEGEERKLIPSPREVKTYDEKPEMSAYEVTAEVLERIASDKYDVIIMNYANCDMVGHTGSKPAAVKAVETVDECVGKVVDAVLIKGGALIVTSDHGNCELMVDPQNNGPHTAHTTYDVEFILVDDRFKNVKLRSGGTLADIIPTFLEMMGIDQPAEMTGKSLLP
ncbi:MAG: 2,3-bisphosphoglycerate-independent phosphoglycerate mutase [Planctomycetota bacterium]|nr:MAG: 2,3-bisphosphoglycerate-independent phosphoglycerate mutase [Planctomycetota bacterium]